MKDQARIMGALSLMEGGVGVGGFVLLVDRDLGGGAPGTHC